MAVMREGSDTLERHAASCTYDFGREPNGMNEWKKQRSDDDVLALIWQTPFLKCVFWQTAPPPAGFHQSWWMKHASMKTANYPLATRMVCPFFFIFVFADWSKGRLFWPSNPPFGQPCLIPSPKSTTYPMSQNPTTNHPKNPPPHQRLQISSTVSGNVCFFYPSQKVSEKSHKSPKYPRVCSMPSFPAPPHISRANSEIITLRLGIKQKQQQSRERKRKNML
jgi:hypothetical protein